MNTNLIKFPRTPHLIGSNVQKGDEDLKKIPFELIKEKKIVIEEKIDGSNTAISFDSEGNLLLQNRGSYLSGGYKEKHYGLLKQWSNVMEEELFNILEDRYIMYGEWMYAKHSVYYDELPHYFIEFDIYDRKEKKFLDTQSRRKLIGNIPIISVPVLKSGRFNKLEEITDLIQKSNYISSKNKVNIYDYCRKHNINTSNLENETDLSGMMEGVYIKVEEDGEVKLRAKFVRPSFTQTIEESESHWSNRSIIPNQLSIPFNKLFDLKYEYKTKHLN